MVIPYYKSPDQLHAAGAVQRTLTGLPGYMGCDGRDICPPFNGLLVMRNKRLV